jgi:hypothetical protein
MLITGRVTILAVCAVLVAGCSSSKSGGGSSPSGPSKATSPVYSPSPSASPRKAKLTYGAKAADVAKALGCTAAHDRPGAPSDLTVEEWLCTFGGQTVGIATYKSADAIETNLAAIKGFAGLAAGGVWVAHGDGWLITVEGDAIPTATNKPVIEQVAATLGGKVEHYEG